MSIIQFSDELNKLYINYSEQIKNKIISKLSTAQNIKELIESLNDLTDDLNNHYNLFQSLALTIENISKAKNNFEELDNYVNSLSSINYPKI